MTPEPGLSVEERELVLGMLAHDVRQPLSVIRAHAQLGLKAAEKAEVQKHLIKIHDACQRMDHLMADLLLYARQQRGTITLQREEVNIHLLLYQLLEEVQSTHPDAKIQLYITGTGVGSWDRERLYQILSNLVGNALRHGDPSKPIQIKCFTLGNNAQCIEVVNQGPPILEERLGSLFKPFTSSMAGSGLGLYIIKFLVNLHGGTIEVHSDVNQTAFRVCLPIIKAEE